MLRFIQTKKVEKPDVVMAIHPHLDGEFWGPTVDLLLDENIKARMEKWLNWLVGLVGEMQNLGNCILHCICDTSEINIFFRHED